MEVDNIQSVVFPKKMFSIKDSIKWLGEHDFNYSKIDEEENTYRFRQIDPKYFDKFISKKLNNGIILVIGNPKNFSKKGGESKPFLEKYKKKINTKLIPVYKDPRIENVREKIYQQDLQRKFNEEQRRYNEEQSQKRQNELEVLKTYTQTLLSQAGIVPPEGYSYITSSEGKRLQIPVGQYLQIKQSGVDQISQDDVNKLLRGNTRAIKAAEDEVIKIQHELDKQVKQNVPKLELEKTQKALRTAELEANKLKHEAKEREEELANRFNINKNTVIDIVNKNETNYKELENYFHHAIMSQKGHKKATYKPTNKAEDLFTYVSGNDDGRRLLKKLEDAYKNVQSDKNIKTDIQKQKKFREILDVATKGSGTKEQEHAEKNVLYDDEINEYLNPLKKRGYLGVYMADEIDNIPKEYLQKEGSFVMNLDKSSGPGYHWVGIYWNLKHPYDYENYNAYFKKKHQFQGLYYYDPFGREPSENFMFRIKQLMDKLMDKFDIDYQIYFNYNHCQDQDKRSYECGWFVMDWIIKMYDGFDPETNCCPSCNGVRDSEKNIKIFEKDLLSSSQ
jgi:hypothetical protein